MGIESEKILVQCFLTERINYIKRMSNICPVVTHFSDSTSSLCTQYREKRPQYYFPDTSFSDTSVFLMCLYSVGKTAVRRIFCFFFSENNIQHYNTIYHIIGAACHKWPTETIIVLLRKSRAHTNTMFNY